MTKLNGLIDQLYKTNYIIKEHLLDLLENIDKSSRDYLIEKAQETRRRYYGTKVFLRGLVEFTNYCQRNCIYCGIRAANKNIERYRLSFNQIMEACEQGYELGYRTFVLQGGEDNCYTDERIVEVVTEISRLCSYAVNR